MSEEKMSEKERKEQEKLRKEVNEIYTPLSVAKKEIQRRWKDKKLRKKVEDFLGGDVPKFLKKYPRAVLARHIATPSFEQINFVKKANSIELKPLFLEYPEDNFDARNPSKYYLGKMFFVSGKGKNGGCKSQCYKLIDFNKNSGKKMVDVKIGLDFGSGKLIDFHHRFLKENLSNFNIYDISPWYKKKGNKPKNYYKYLLALFIRNGILFENFLIDKDESVFTKDILMPNIGEIKKIFGIKPLIVKLLPEKTEAEPSWYWYPSLLEKSFARIMPNKNNR